jgi:hypothetical protein
VRHRPLQGHRKQPPFPATHAPTCRFEQARARRPLRSRSPPHGTVTTSTTAPEIERVTSAAPAGRRLYFSPPPPRTRCRVLVLGCLICRSPAAAAAAAAAEPVSPHGARRAEIKPPTSLKTIQYSPQSTRAGDDRKGFEPRPSHARAEPWVGGAVGA